MAGLFGPQDQRQGLLRAILSGQADPRLSRGQNRQASQAGLLQAGLGTILASSGAGGRTPGTLEALAQGVLTGQQAALGIRERLVAQDRRAQIQSILNDPQITGDLTPRERFLLRASEPDEALAMLQEIVGREPVAVAEGTQLVDPRSGDVVFNNEPTPTAEPSNLRTAARLVGIAPENLGSATPEQLQAVEKKLVEIATAGSSSTRVTITPEDAEARGIAGVRVAQFEKVMSDAREADSQIESLAVMQGLLNDGVETGGLSNLTLPLRSIGASLGIANAEDLGQQELFRSISNKLALERKEGLQGQMSDRDIIFLKEQVPQIANTREGNQSIVEFLSRIASRKVQIADLMNNYVDTNDSLRGWNSFLRDWIRDNPLFEDLNPDIFDDLPAGSDPG